MFKKEIIVSLSLLNINPSSTVLTFYLEQEVENIITKVLSDCMHVVILGLGLHDQYDEE